eukprot:c27797_g1_i1 orf=383-1603(-)
MKESKGLRKIMVTMEQSTNIKNEDISTADSNALWQLEKVSLENEKYNLQISLSESKKALQHAYGRAEKMETAANDANARVNELETQLEKLRSDSRILKDINILLQAQRKNQELELRDLESRKQEQDVQLRDLRAHRDALKLEIQKITEAFDMTMDENSRSEQDIQATQDELLKAKEDNNTLRKLWADASERASSLERLNRHFKTNLKEVEERLQLALDEINSQDTEREKIWSEVEQEQALKCQLMREIRLLEHQRSNTEQELASSKSLISKMEENAIQLEQQLSDLQKQVARMSQERSYLEATICESEVHVHKSTANSVKTEENVKKLKQNVEDSEIALATVKESSNINKNKVSSSLEEAEFSKALLQRQGKSILMALPRTSVSISCTLVAISIFALLRLYKHKRN